MEIKQIPQDDSKIFRGQKKVIYATANGQYQSATSNGWAAEEFATEQAVEELKQLTRNALELVKIKRHFRPTIFQKLSEQKLAKYAEVFQIDIEALKHIDEQGGA